MTDLTLVRHGETVWHADNRYTGSTDIALTERGRQQADQLASWAKQAHLDAIWVSPLERARNTAAPCERATGLTASVDKRLAELDFGAGEGLTSSEMLTQFPDARRAFEQDPVAGHLPDSEDPRHATERAVDCLKDIVHKHPSDRVLVVGHGTVKRLVLCHLLGIPLRHYRDMFPVVRNCGVTTIRWNGTGHAALIEYNTPIDFPAYDPGKDMTP
ncbi:histidine phosphatase family protein [Hoyosella altamirensis]|uniref:Putative phosphoglycerate mutase n=1 Tax=Hoyosella altamirensis TaxID=616997 RepID=A0A839RIP4_9ACTN|nr:histidine phosphatase family protein [Hoyosella altamirensis]MBB3036535.1 putative phosphoglycerate mutase [Hoyosella altamirensis]